MCIDAGTKETLKNADENEQARRRLGQRQEEDLSLPQQTTREGSAAVRVRRRTPDA
jgi:hypothetical protein